MLYAVSRRPFFLVRKFHKNSGLGKVRGKQGGRNYSGQLTKCKLYASLRHFCVTKGTICRYKSCFSSSRENTECLNLCPEKLQATWLKRGILSSQESLRCPEQVVPKLFSVSAALYPFHSLPGFLLLLGLYFYSVLNTFLLSSTFFHQRIESDHSLFPGCFPVIAIAFSSPIGSLLFNPQSKLPSVSR